MSKELRPYQIDCHNSIIREYRNGVNKQLVVLFTGAGKTYTTIKLLEKMGFKRILWLSFQEELISQSGLAFIKDAWPELHNQVQSQGFLDYIRSDESKLGCIKADIFKVDKRVTLGSIMTLHRRLDKFSPDYFDCIVADEAHLYLSTTAVSILNFFTPKLLIGLTATPHRADGLPMSDIFQKITFDYGLDKGIKDKYACELDAIRVKTTTNLDSVRTTAGEFNLKDLTNEINSLARNQLIVEKYKAYCEGRPCIAFCVDIQHAMDLAEQFRMNGYDCQAVSSNEELTPNRTENIYKFKSGQLQIITNVNILVAGFDHPDTGAIIMACPTKSLTKYLQAVGRGARLKSEEYVSKFKQNCIILDIVDVTSKHNLVNAWELDKDKAPEDRVFISEEKREKLLAERAKSAMLHHQRMEDERISLLSLPKVFISKSYKQSEDATTAQLAVIQRWGYPIENAHYTKAMISEIFGKQEISAWARRELQEWGYEHTGFISVTQHQAARKEHEAKCNLVKK